MHRLLALGIPITIAAVIAAPFGARLAPHVNTSLLLALFAAFLAFAGAMMLFYRRPATARTHSRHQQLGADTQLKHLIGLLLWVAAAKIIWDLTTG